MKFGTVLVVKKRTTKKTLQLAGRRLALTDFAAASFSSFLLPLLVY